MVEYLLCPIENFQRSDQLLNFIDNHDAPRLLAKSDRQTMRQALLFIMTIPGVPVIYYGTEQELTGMRQAMFKGGVGSIDKTFGLLFGFFKGYIISICLFSIFNWFYPYQNWGISTEDAFSFNIVKKGSEILVEEFPSSEDFMDTKDKIEKI